MRVLYVSSVDISVPYGPGVNERGFIRDMVQKLGDEFQALIPKPLYTELNDMPRGPVNFTTYGLGSRSYRGFLEARTLGAVTACRMAKNFKPDFLAMRIGALPICELLVAKSLPGIPYALKTAGSGDMSRFYERNTGADILRSMDNKIRNRLINGAAQIDVVSSDQARSFVEHYPAVTGRVEVIPNGVDVELFNDEKRDESRTKFGWEKKDIVIGYVGGFPMYRGGREVIDLVSKFQDRDVYGVVVGDSGQAESCKLYAEKSGVADRMLITGQIDYLALPFIMSGLDVGISALRQNERHESEQKVRQYLATGAYVIGTQGSNDFLKGVEFASVVEDEDSDTLAQALKKFLNFHYKQRQGLRESARHFAHQKLATPRLNDIRMESWKKHCILDY